MYLLQKRSEKTKYLSHFTMSRDDNERIEERKKREKRQETRERNNIEIVQYK